MKQKNWLIYYQCSLAVLTVLLFFTNLDIYLERAGILNIEPLHWIILLIVASIPLALSLSTRKKFLPQGLIRFCGGYFVISLFYFWLFLSTQDAFQTLKDRILSIIFMLLTMLVFSKFYIVQLWTRYAILVISQLNLFNNLYELCNPLAFNGLNETGRPAGFYVDSNSSGDALILSMIFGIDLVNPKYRVPFVLLIGLGVFITFSRGALLGWLILMIFFTFMGVIPRNRLFWWSIILVIIITALMQTGEDLVNQLQLADLLNDNILRRLEELTSPSTSLQDDAAVARLKVVQLSWQMFTEHPFIGNGLGSTLHLDVGALSDHDISTHNMYLYYMADHGILGAFFLPLLIYIVTCNAQSKETKYISFAFAVFIFIWGFFSHTIMTQRLHLMTFSLIATMNQVIYKVKT
jgi:hypothetical protein